MIAPTLLPAIFPLGGSGVTWDLQDAAVPGLVFPLFSPSPPPAQLQRSWSVSWGHGELGGLLLVGPQAPPLPQVRKAGHVLPRPHSVGKAVVESSLGLRQQSSSPLSLSSGPVYALGGLLAGL